MFSTKLEPQRAFSQLKNLAESSLIDLHDLGSAIRILPIADREFHQAHIVAFRTLPFAGGMA